jgi:hypothetical protein
MPDRTGFGEECQLEWGYSIAITGLLIAFLRCFRLSIDLRCDANDAKPLKRNFDTDPGACRQRTLLSEFRRGRWIIQSN